jgi:hypothetical protein
MTVHSGFKRHFSFPESHLQMSENEDSVNVIPYPDGWARGGGRSFAAAWTRC